MNEQRPLAIALALVLVGFSAVRAGDVAEVDQAYPNELPGYHFHARASWHSLQPLASKQSEVVAALGTERTTGFSFEGRWSLTVYYMGGGDCDGIPYPSFLKGTVATIELVPKTRVSFLDVRFPAAFHKSLEMGPHDPVRSWQLYQDEFGLEYRVYEKDSSDGAIRAGDLKSITYGAPRRRYEAMTGCAMPRDE